MAGPKLEITFSSKAELEGAKQYAAELERNIGKSKAMGKETADLQTQLKTLKTSIADSEQALASETTATEKGGEATKKLTDHKKVLKDVVKGLAFEFPVLARAIGFFINPATLLAAVLGVLVGVFQKWFRSIDEASAAQAKLEGLGDSIGSVARNAKDVIAQGDQFNESLNKITSASETAADRMNRLNGEIDRNRRLQDELSDKGLALEVEKLKEQEREKRISPRQRIQREMELRNSFERDKAERELKALEDQKTQADLAERNAKHEMDAATGAQPSASKRAELKAQAEDAAKKAQAEQLKFDTIAEERRNKIADLVDERKAVFGTGLLEGAAGQAKRVLEMGPLGIMVTPSDYDRQIAEQEAAMISERQANEEAQRNADAARRRHEQVESRAKEAEQRRQAAAKTMADAAAKGKDLQSDIDARRAFQQQAKPIDEATRQSAANQQLGDINDQETRKLLDFHYQMIEQADAMPPEQRKKFLDRLNPRPTPKRPAQPPYPRTNPRPAHPAFPPDRPGSPGSRRGVDDVGERGRGFADAGDGAKDIVNSGMSVAGSLDSVTQAVLRNDQMVIEKLNALERQLNVQASQIRSGRNV